LLFLIVLASGIAALAQEKPLLVAYDLKVVIEPRPGTISVHGKIGVPVARDAKTLQFGLHETFAIRKLLINHGAVTFSFQPGDPNPIFPATKNVVVNLPASTQAGEVQLEIEYEGRLKDIPEFGTFPDQTQALDDQINSRLVELANYSVWYPKFFVYGRPIAATLEVSLPKGWIASVRERNSRNWKKMEGR
jgi:hypothetical protein